MVEIGQEQEHFPLEAESVFPLQLQGSEWCIRSCIAFLCSTSTGRLVEIGQERKALYLWGERKIALIISHDYAAGWLKHHTCDCLHILYKPCKFGWNRILKKGTLLLRPKQFLSLSRSTLQRGDWQSGGRIPCPRSRSYGSLVEIGW
jgi:hypothetical protein